MFTALNDKNTFGYPFEKIRNAIAVPSEKNGDAATSSGLEVLSRRYDAFRQELDAAGELGNWEYDLDTYNHCIAVLQRYFTGNPSGLTERDARIYSHYLQTEHKGFVKLAEELAADRGIHTEGGISQQ
ncbi:hypothetical protein K9U58_004745 [Escherichia coli]|nr:hypothetical protein [Escherichia coli]